jgi:hypothetical protein
MNNYFPEKKYLCQFYEDVCDEGNIYQNMIVKGEDMPRLMQTRFKVGFGNLEDGEDFNYLVKERISYKSITDEEIIILKKFNLINIETGWIYFEDDYFN